MGIQRKGAKTQRREGTGERTGRGKETRGQGCPRSDWLRCVKGFPRGYGSDALEVYEAVLRVNGDEAQTGFFADIETTLTADDAAFRRHTQ